MLEAPPASTWPIHRPQAVRLAIGFAAIVASWVALGALLTGPLHRSAIERFDQRISRWFAGHRSTGWNTMSWWGSQLADTWTKVAVTVVVVLVMMQVWKRWFEPVVVVTSLVLEAGAFVVVTSIVGRPRPAVAHLDASPIGSSFPSGHVAAAVVYGAFAVVVRWHTPRRSWRLVSIAACIAVSLVVAVSRVYRGMHFLIDTVAGGLLGAAILVLTIRVLSTSPESSDVPRASAARSPASDASGRRS